MEEGTRGSTDVRSPADLDAAGDGLETLRSTLAEPSDEPLGFEADPIQIGRFVVLRRLGAGGMGVVYAAYDNELDRKLAIKLVRAERARGDESRARVRREAQAMARLSHPNVVQVYEVGEHHGQIYVAMEFVTGPTLAELAAAQPPGPERWRVMLDKYVDAGRGLAAAHAAGIVHRDFKPANAIVGEDGRVRVLDFGIARAPGSGASEAGDHVADRSGVDPLATPLTITGVMVGTPAYMSPEQFERRTIDARSDQFSFCVALYEALYRERPFAGVTTNALVLAVVGGTISPPPPAAEVPGWIREILVRGLAGDPDARWPSMTELLAALSHDPAQIRRRRRRRSLVAALTLSAIVGSIWFARGQQRSAVEAELARREAQQLEAQARQRKAEAEAERDRALREAQAAAVRARDTARVLAARGLTGDPSSAAALLRDVERPAEAPGWRTTAIDVLQQPPCEQVLRGHEDRIVFLDVSPDDRWLVSASFDGTARIWPLDGGPATVLRHDDQVLSARFSPAGDQVLTASADHTAALWPMPRELGTAAEPTILRGHTDMLWAGEFSHDGRRVVTASRDGTARVWTLAEPETPTVLAVADAHVWWAEFSSDDRHIVAAAGNGEVGVWSVAEPERPPILLTGHRESVGDAHFNAAGDRVVTASTDGTARVFAIDLAAWTAHETAVLRHDDVVYRVELSPDGRRIVTVSRDHSAKLWSLDDDGALIGAPQIFADHSGTVWSGTLSPDGRMLAIGGRDRAVEVWPLAGGPPFALLGHTSDVFRVRFSHDGRRLFSGSHDGTVRVWSGDWRTPGRELVGRGAQITELEQRGELLIGGGGDEVWVWPIRAAGPIAGEAPIVLGGHDDPVRVVGSARALASGDATGRVRIWPLDSNEVVEPERPLVLQAPSPNITALAIDAEAELVVATTLDGVVVHWQLAPGLTQPVVGPRALTRSRGLLRSSGLLAFSPDSQLLVSADADGRVLAWRRDQLLSEPGPGRISSDGIERPSHLLFSPDSQRLALAVANRVVRVWSVADLDRAPLELETSTMINRLAFDSSGRYLAGGGSDATVIVWDLDAPGSSPRRLTGPAGEVRDLAFAPDDRHLAAASLDGTVHVWPLTRADGRHEIGEPVSFDAGELLYRLAFVDAGRRIAAAGYGSSIRLWYLGESLDVATLRARLEQATSLCLSATQRMQYAGESQEAAEAGLAACLRSSRD